MSLLMKPSGDAYLPENHRWKYKEGERVYITYELARRQNTNGYVGPFTVMNLVDVQGEEAYDLLGGGKRVTSARKKDVLRQPEK